MKASQMLRVIQEESVNNISGTHSIQKRSTNKILPGFVNFEKKLRWGDKTTAIIRSDMNKVPESEPVNIHIRLSQSPLRSRRCENVGVYPDEGITDHNGPIPDTVSRFIF